MPLEAALANDEASQTRIGRALATFSVQLALESAVHVPPEVFLGDDAFRKHSESVIRRLAVSSDCVIVGRAAAIVIGKVPASLHVRLDGSRHLRILQGAKALNISADESARRMLETDRARSLYVRHFYATDPGDAALYHMVLDSTEITLATCADVIVAAAVDRFGVPWS
jgi:cytidylate kinase